MSSKRSADNWQAGGREQLRGRAHNGFGQPASDSERLRQFASAYDEHMRHTGAPVSSFGMGELRSHMQLWWALIGLVVFVLLLAVAMGVGVLVIGHR